MKKIYLFLSAPVVVVALTGLLHAQDAKMPGGAEQGARRAAAIAGAQQLLQRFSRETNALAKQLPTAHGGKAFWAIVDTWSDAFKVYRDEMKALQAKTGCKFLKEKEPAEEARSEFTAGVKSVQVFWETVLTQQKLQGHRPPQGSEGIERIHDRTEKILGIMKDNTGGPVCDR